MAERGIGALGVRHQGRLVGIVTEGEPTVINGEQLRGMSDAHLDWELDQAEVVFGNLETPLTARGARAEKAATHRVHPDRVAEVRRFGFDVVTLAPSHGDPWIGRHEMIAGVLADQGQPITGAKLRHEFIGHQRAAHPGHQHRDAECEIVHLHCKKPPSYG